MMLFHAQFVDLEKRAIYPVDLMIKQGKIEQIKVVDRVPEDAGYLLPGFVDAHVHIESSMLPPAEFARLAVVHGTVATVSDPHEIANVLGVEGVHYMLDEARKVPFKFCIGAPSCVPATTFETAGAAIDAKAVEELLKNPEIGYLSEMMNFPGVLHQEEQVMAKLESARRLQKPIDGHAPGLRGEGAVRYYRAGITTDHECFTYEEGLEKAKLGVKILIREGSAARNFAALWPLIREFPEQVMFCSDDKHPDDLIKGHINQLVARAIAKGCDLFDVLRAACIYPVEHYGLKVGQLQVGDPADFILVNDLKDFIVKETWLDGHCVAKNGNSLIERKTCGIVNHFRAHSKKTEEFALPTEQNAPTIRLIEALDGEIVTKELEGILPAANGFLLPDVSSDILKIAVVNRYREKAKVAVGFVRGFGLQKGAIASSVAHDSHNIVAVGTNDEALCRAVNAVIEARGGVSATDNDGAVKLLPLPIAGLMSPEDGYTLARQYSQIDQWVKSELSCRLQAPFMVLSFLALPVIPDLKITDLGLFDVNQFAFTSVEK